MIYHRAHLTMFPECILHSEVDNIVLPHLKKSKRYTNVKYNNSDNV